MTTRRLTRHLRHRTLSSSAFSSLLLVAVSVTFFLLETLRVGGYFFLPADPDPAPRRLFLSLSAVSWPLLLTSAACLCLVSQTSTRSGAVVVGTDGVRRFYVSGPGLTGLLLFFLWAAAGAGLVTAADVYLIIGSRARWAAAGRSSWPAMIAGGISAALAGWTAATAVWHAVLAGRDFAAPTTEIQMPRDAEAGGGGGGGGGGGDAWANDPYAGGGAYGGWPPGAAPPLGARPPLAPDGAYAAAPAPTPPPPGGYFDVGRGAHHAFGAPGAAVVAPPAGWAAAGAPPSGPTGPVAGAPYVPPPAAGVPPHAPPPDGSGGGGYPAAAVSGAAVDADAAHAAGVAAQARAHRLAACVATCVGMGFDVGAARLAADATDGDVSAAVAQLLAAQGGG